MYTSIIAGSSGRNELKPESDYDIVLVLYEYPYPIHVILTTIEECDLHELKYLSKQFNIICMLLGIRSDLASKLWASLKRMPMAMASSKFRRHFNEIATTCR